MPFLEQSKKEKLNQLAFQGCENVLIGDVLHYCEMEKSEVLVLLKSLLGIVKKLFFKKFSFSVFDNPNTLCLHSSFVLGRKDYERAFFDVAELVENKVVMLPSKGKFSLQHLKYLSFLLECNKKLKEININTIYRWWYINFIFNAFLAYKDFELEQEKNKWEIKNLITFCDVHPTDCFFVQKFNSAKKTTVTLQHGAFAISYDAWAYSGSKSNYFFADSPHTVENAKSVGYKGEIIPVGSIHCINEKPGQQPSFFKSDSIGIIMNSSMMPVEDNIAMLETVQEYCRKYNKKAYIKYHPLNNPADYTHVIDSTVAIECEKSTTIKEFFEMIDINIVCDSTVFCTSLFNWIPAFLFYRDGYDSAKYLHTEAIKFSTVDQFEKIMEKITRDDFMEQMKQFRNYFLSPGTIKDNYKSVFKEIGIINDK